MEPTNNRVAYYTHKGTSKINAPEGWGAPRGSHGPRGQTFFFFPEVGLQFMVVDTSRGGTCSHRVELTAIADFREVRPLGRGLDITRGDAVFGVTGDAGTDLETVLKEEIETGEGDHHLLFRGKPVHRGSRDFLNQVLSFLAPQLSESPEIVPIQ